MELPKFLLGDNTDFQEDIFIVHLDYPRFIINLKDDEVEFIEEAEDLDEGIKSKWKDYSFTTNFDEMERYEKE
jgi:hypothetical protein